MKYKLLKDTPLCKAGTIFVEYGNYLQGGGDTVYNINKSMVMNFDEWFAPLDERWKPKRHEEYWSICADGSVYGDVWEDYDNDMAQYNFGNCFPTEEKAISAAKAIEELLLSLHKN